MRVIVAALADLKAPLETICSNRTEENTEVWGRLFRDDPRFCVADLHESDPVLARPDVRMTLDYDADYRFFQTVADALRKGGRYPSFEAVMAHLASHPGVIALNRDAQAEYELHLSASAARAV